MLPARGPMSAFLLDRRQRPVGALPTPPVPVRPLMAVESRFTDHLLQAWASGRSSLLPTG